MHFNRFIDISDQMCRNELFDTRSGKNIASTKLLYDFENILMFKLENKNCGYSFLQS